MDNEEYYYPDLMPEAIKKYCEWHHVAYGWNPFGGIKCFGCGKQIAFINVYRCYECDMPFHKECLIQHCDEIDQITP